VNVESRIEGPVSNTQQLPEVRALLASPPRWGRLLTIFCFGLGFGVALGQRLAAPWLEGALQGSPLPLPLPGGLGFTGLEFIIQKQVVTGLDTAFQASFVASALLTGLLLAHATVSSRTAL
jgi:hypothetical protein